MITKHTYNDITWIDVQSPKKDEIALLVKEYSISTLVAEEFMSETVRSKVDIYDNLIYLILHFPKIHSSNPEKTEQEIDFVIGKNFLITIHYEHINSLHKFFKKFEKDSLFEKKDGVNHAGYLFYHLIKELYKNVLNELEEINLELIRIEHDIFEGKEKETVKVILNTNRKILDFKQAMRFHLETLKSFESAGAKFFGPEFLYYLEATISEYNKIRNVLDNHKNLLNDLHQTNDSLLSYKTNETMKFLTVITFLTSPITVISGLFMMNTDFVLLHTLRQFYFAIGAMVLVSLFIFILFKVKKWL